VRVWIIALTGAGAAWWLLRRDVSVRDRAIIVALFWLAGLALITLPLQGVRLSLSTLALALTLLVAGEFGLLALVKRWKARE
jgi:hypothetical protein